MKTILVPTDLSAPAKNASWYALQLAKTLKMNVKLCNAVLIPAETMPAAQMAWPAEEYDELQAEGNKELAEFAQKQMKLDARSSAVESFHPEITWACEIGRVADIVRNTVSQERIPLVVMGMSGAGSLSRLLLGSNSRTMIDVADFPLLLIPSTATYRPLKKIAYATDLDNVDIQIIQSLASLAHAFNAEIIITHISPDKFEDAAHNKRVAEFLKEVTSKVNYGLIYYRHVQAIDAEHGLDWICEHSKVQMLTMSHEHKSLFKKLWASSDTQKLARHTRIPLLIYPKSEGPASRTFF